MLTVRQTLSEHQLAVDRDTSNREQICSQTAIFLESNATLKYPASCLYCVQGSCADNFHRYVVAYSRI